MLAVFGFLFLSSNAGLADDDGDDRYEEYEKDDDDDDEKDKKKKKKTAEPVKIISQPQIIRAVPAPAAKAPAPDLTRIYDTDADGIVDAIDAYPGEDDFIYKIEDGNRNGIADDLEFLKINR